MKVIVLIILAITTVAVSDSEDQEHASAADSLLAQSGYALSAADVCVTVETDRVHEKCLPDQAQICPTNFANYPELGSDSQIEVRIENSSLKNMMFLLDCLLHWRVEFPERHGDDRLQPLHWKGTVGTLDEMDLVTDDGTKIVVRASPKTHHVVVQVRE